ncbi:putative NADP(+)-dependent dehydrogenase [Lipomyces tetrasporus]|uniref:NADP(+)-dependent dehydrogenase n=1 Tax=Lipomyces tetrasporus TaxID=54092 RepID=A0AAD7QNF1_9ASCO|nr:putative NADP(+)-dependent dehydrogenase [Lipomyces tetrasporus]KAJ8098061.1 putative NADP(+)-dependent dehydrogenase [Lipomyces tetrasporus]
MAFPYKHFLLIGATSGIGQAMADRLIEAGAKVTAVGRREDRLEDFVSRHGQSRAKAVPFDISNKEQIPQFAADVMRTSPDIDCIFLNAGIQRPPCDFSHPEHVDLAQFNLEIDVNFSSSVAITHAFLPFLISKQSQTSLIFTGSNLAIVPGARLPGYSASKAALNAFVLCLREQLRNTNVQVIEVSPPPVQTELHDYMGEETGRNLGMPLSVFTEEAYRGLAAGHDQIVIGSIGPAETFHEIIDKRRSAFTALAMIMRGGS